MQVAILHSCTYCLLNLYLNTLRLILFYSSIVVLDRLFRVTRVTKCKEILHCRLFGIVEQYPQLKRTIVLIFHTFTNSNDRANILYS